MKYLKTCHIPMDIATSSYRKNILPTFRQLGLDNYIDVIVGREDVENVKPDPDLYLTAVQNLNYNPTNCLAIIEDSVNGATAAILAGLDVIVNTNITKVQDFSSIQLTGKDMSFEDIKLKLLEH